MARKGQFKKGGGRVGAAKKHRSSPKTKTIVRTRTNTVVRTRRAPARKAARRHRRHGSGTPKLLHIAAAAAALAYVTGPKGPEMVRTYGAKIPGSATFGVPAVVGLAALAVDRFAKPNKWLKLLGVAGIVLAASKVGEMGTDFKYVGDADEYAGDLEDVGDEGDLGDDDVGDDDVGYDED